LEIFNAHYYTEAKNVEFGAKYPEAAQPLDRWYRIVKRTDFVSFADLRRIFPSADQVGKLTVFNIGGNKFRLITYIVYASRRVYIRKVLTHKEYDEGKWKE
jgi:mRNA interferase HigB